MKKYILILSIMSIFLLSACQLKKQNDTDKNLIKENDLTSNQKEIENNQIANPASANCIDNGGNHIIKTNGEGDQYGVCIFQDNFQCEEWALLNGKCPVGGFKVTGYDNDAQIYCSIIGGEVNMGNNICKLKNNIECNIDDLFNAKCSY